MQTTPPPKLHRPPSLKLVMTVGVSLLMVASGLTAGFFALRSFYRYKVTDTLAIVFLELERSALNLERQATAVTIKLAKQESGPADALPDAAFRIAPDQSLQALRGGLKPNLTMSSFGLGGQAAPPPGALFVQYAGETFAALFAEGAAAAVRLHEPTLAAGRYLLLWKVDVADWLSNAAASVDGSKVYVLTRQGALLYSNSRDVTATSYGLRPLVRKFIDAPLRLGQVRYPDKSGAFWYGFFYEVPNTNMVAFVETPRDKVQAPVKKAAIQYGLMMLAGLGVVLLGLQVLLAKVNAPLQQLILVARRISQGEFQVGVDTRGYAEIQDLAFSFRDMASDLAIRDDRIKILMEEQRDAARLQSEVELARTLQITLLPRAGLPLSSGLELGITYQPATELAGDWYGHHYIEASGETTLTLADISGHGAGSAMFMTLIAGAFEELRGEHPVNFPAERFIQKVHMLLATVGQRQWHATVQVAQFKRGSGEIDIWNAGSPFPVLLGLSPDISDVPLVVRMPSSLVGVSELDVGHRRLAFPRGASIVMISDGLTEAHNPAGKRYGTKRFVALCKSSQYGGAQEISDALRRNWLDYIGGSEILDDLCILTAKAV